jgi:hypothetical protein
VSRTPLTLAMRPGITVVQVNESLTLSLLVRFGSA